MIVINIYKNKKLKTTTTMKHHQQQKKTHTHPYIYITVCPRIMLTFLHASPSDFTCNLIPTPGKFLHAFQPALPFLISVVMLKLIEATLHTDLSCLFWSRRLTTPPFHCSSSESQQLWGYCKWTDCRLQAPTWGRETDTIIMVSVWGSGVHVRRMVWVSFLLLSLLFNRDEAGYVLLVKHK